MDRRTARMVILFAALSVVGCASSAALGPASPGVRSVDPAVAPILTYLASTSPTLRSALAAIDGAGYPIDIHTFEGAAGGTDYSSAFGFEYGFTRAYLNADGKVLAIVVALDVLRLRRDGRDMGVPDSVLVAEMAVVLAHELYGHAIPLVVGGTVESMCHDRVPVYAPCALERENRIRSDLGVAPRRSYDRVDLAVTAMRDAMREVPVRAGGIGLAHSVQRGRPAAGRVP